MKQEYTVDYFIKKFEAIPEYKWLLCLMYDSFGNHCAEGWAIEFGGEECKDSLQELFNEIGIEYASCVNNEQYGIYSQPTPKQRVLAALYDIKKIQEEQVGKEKPLIQYENAIPEILKSIQNPTIETDVLIQPTFHVPHCL